MKNWFYIIFSIVLTTSALSSCNDGYKTNAHSDLIVQRLTCSAEENKGDLFLCHEKSFFNGLQRSADYSHTGNYSCKTNKSAPYAFTVEFRNVKKGELIHAEIWFKSAKPSKVGNVIISDNKTVQYDSNCFTAKTEGEWTLMTNTFKAIKDYDVVKVYGLNSTNSDIYFDDASIVRMSSTPKPPVTDSTLRIYIPPHQFSLLDSFLTEGRKEMILRKEFKKYVKGFILQKGDSTPVKLRLKGDWTDHLKTDKYSLRIKTSGNNAYNGLKSFSIQNPETRGMMLEWYIHQICAEEDLLTTRYDFVNVEINGEIKGAYALEEHFDKQLLEARNRREGPIVKLDEEGLWQLNYDLETKPRKVLSPAFMSSTILPFKKNRTHKSATLHEQFLVAQSNLNKYKNLESDPNNYVNLEAFAKYIAILDLGNVDHAQAWHNQRQYYNPVTAKLEPILYDCFQDKQHITGRRLFYLVDEVLTERRPTNLNLALLRDVNFRDFYLSYIQKLGSVDYIKNFNENNAAKIQSNLDLLAYEYPFYQAQVDLDFFEKSARAMESEKDSLLTFMKDFKEVTFVKDVWQKFPDTLDYFRPAIALKAHLENEEGGMKKISLRNFHQSDISVKAYSTDSLPDQLILLDSSVDFTGFTSDYETKHLFLPSDVKYVYYVPKNLGGKLIREKISKWPLPDNIDVRGDFSSVLNQYKKKGIITIPKGTYSFTKNVVATDAEKLIIEAGSSIDLTNTAGFISYIPVEIKGTPKNPVHIFSSDSTGSGFNVFSEHGHSILENTHFTGLNSMNKNHWILTGAVTLYGGSVAIANCSFNDNQCEDGLNIIRSKFTMTESTVSNTLSDGFDADFCTGVLSNSVITLTKNDALDFSGSQIEIIGCEISKAGDKGISGGENSQLKISNTSINGAVIGIASKDYSQLEVTDVRLKNCDYTYAAFRKKPEYGPASITVTPSSEQVKGRMLLDLDSKITIGSKVSVGKEKLDIESLYSNK
jgi:hypothetical protein